jgi:hypothetical protein
MKPNLVRTMLGGFAGTVAITLTMYFVSPMMGVKMDIAGSLGKMLGGSWALGMMMHFINGTIIFPMGHDLHWDWSGHLQLDPGKRNDTYHRKRLPEKSRFYGGQLPHKKKRQVVSIVPNVSDVKNSASSEKSVGH